MATNESGRVVLIFAAVAVAAGAGGYYFIKVYKPKEALAAARADVGAWDKRFAAARACLLGDTPASSVTNEALAVREMSPDPWDRHSCTDMISKLARDAPNSGIEMVEQAWDVLDKTAIAGAQAFATHIAASTTLTKDPLPAALDALDAARNQLFASVALTVPGVAGQPLPRVVAIPIVDDGAPVDHPSAPLTPSAHGLVLNADTPSHQLQVTLTPGGTPRVDHVAAGAMRSPNDPSWGAIVDGTGVHVGTFDKDGVMTTTASLPLKDGVLAAVGGTREQGLVVAGNTQQVVFATVKGGAMQALPAVAIDAAEAVTDANGDVGVMLSSGSSHKARTWRAGAFHDLDLGGDVDADPRMCLTRDRMAVSAQLIDCMDDAWLQDAGERMRDVCSPDCRHATLPRAAPDGAAVTVIAGKLVALATHGGVVGMWREDGSHSFFAAPGPTSPVLGRGGGLAMTDGKVIDLLERDDRGLVILRVPVSASAR